VFIIDGMNGIEAGYHFAGAVGVGPRGYTLRQLWMMAEGAAKMARRKTLELATLVWSLGDVDVEDFLHFGHMNTTGKGGPVQLTPDLHARIEAEVARIRRENPGLPQAGRRADVS
jgi:hypothetical protein